MPPADEAPRRFRDALERARLVWSAVTPFERGLRAGCQVAEQGILVPFFGREHLVTHPEGEVTAAGRPVSAAVAILLLHYLGRADGTPEAGDWVTFRELPDGLFYATSFAARAEGPVAQAFGLASGPDALAPFRATALAASGEELQLADASFAFRALPRLRLAVLLWLGDEDLPPEARIVFDASAGHYLPAEDLAGLGEVLARRLLSAAP